jgi:hypothetical protein
MMTDQQFSEIMGQLALLKVRLAEIEGMIKAGRPATHNVSVRLPSWPPQDLPPRNPLRGGGDVSKGIRKVGLA